MSIGNAVLMLLPAIGLFFLVGLTASWIEDMAAHYAKRELRFDEEQERMQAAFESVTATRQNVVEMEETKAERERTLSQLSGQVSEAMSAEIKLTDPRQLTMYESGYPTPGASGFYVKAVGPAQAAPFDGPGSTTSGVHGRRYARLVIWGKDQANANKLAKHWAGPQGQITIFRPFSGKLKLVEV